eukprot:Rhum_TRINITY_DN11079_c0_g1::Rhum_TRINITY_DN11079_c0_g1_i1::g.42273::m.42273
MLRCAFRTPSNPGRISYCTVDPSTDGLLFTHLCTDHGYTPATLRIVRKGQTVQRSAMTEFSLQRWVAENDVFIVVGSKRPTPVVSFTPTTEEKAAAAAAAAPPAAAAVAVAVSSVSAKQGEGEVQQHQQQDEDWSSESYDSDEFSSDAPPPPPDDPEAVLKALREMGFSQAVLQRAVREHGDVMRHGVLSDLVALLNTMSGADAPSTSSEESEDYEVAPSPAYSGGDADGLSAEERDHVTNLTHIITGLTFDQAKSAYFRHSKDIYAAARQLLGDD